MYTFQYTKEPTRGSGQKVGESSHQVPPPIYSLTLVHAGKLAKSPMYYELSEEMIHEGKLYDTTQLHRFARSYFFIECEFELVDRYRNILKPETELFPKNPERRIINIVFRHIRNLVNNSLIPGYEKDVFFMQHGIVLSRLKNRQMFKKCIDMITQKHVLASPYVQLL